MDRLVNWFDARHRHQIAMAAMDLLPIESYRFAMICLPWVACRLLVAAICLWSFFFSNKFLWAGVWPCATQIWGESTTHSPSPPKTFVSQTQKVTPQRRNALPWSALISSSLHLFLEQSLISIQSYTINLKSDSNRLLLARYGKIWPGCVDVQWIFVPVSLCLIKKPAAEVSICLIS